MGTVTHFHHQVGHVERAVAAAGQAMDIHTHGPGEVHPGTLVCA